MALTRRLIELPWGAGCIASEHIDAATANEVYAALLPSMGGFTRNGNPLAVQAGTLGGQVVTPAGPAFSPSGVRSADTAVGWAGQGNGTATTLIAVLIPTTASTTASSVVGFLRTSDGAGFVGLQSGTGSAQSWSFVAGATRTTSPATWEVGKPTTVVMVLQRNGIGLSSRCEMYVDGALAVSDTSGFSQGSYALSGSLYANAGSASCCVALAVALRRACSPSEARLFSADPRQLIEPQRIIVPTQSAAAAAPTITALSARLITASSAQPRISYS